MQLRGYAQRLTARLPMSTAVVSAVLIVVVMVCMGLRVGYPFELEWMEGGINEHIHRVVEGQPIYGEPSLEWTPFLYTPLYYYVCAVAASVFGPSLAVARVVSMVSTWVSIYLVGALARDRSGQATAGWIAAGLFAGTYHYVGGWYDIARMDSLALMLLLVGFRLADPEKGFGRAAATGFVLFLAFFAKQPTLAAAVPTIVFLLVAAPRKGLVAAVTYGAGVLGSTAIWDAATDGWYSFYVWEMSREHQLFLDQAPTLWWNNSGRVTGMILIAVAGSVRFERTREGIANWIRWSGTLAATMVAGLVGVMHTGGGINTFIPLFAFGPVVAVTAVYEHESSRSRLYATGLLLVTAQLFWLVRDPRPLIPGDSQLEARREIVAQLSKHDGPLWAPGYLTLARRSGREGPRAHMMALRDVFKTRRRKIHRRLRWQQRRAIKKHEFAGVLLGNESILLQPAVNRGLEKHYELAATVVTPGFEYRVFPPTGYSAYPMRYLTLETNGTPAAMWVGPEVPAGTR